MDILVSWGSKSLWNADDSTHTLLWKQTNQLHYLVFFILIIIIHFSCFLRLPLTEVKWLYNNDQRLNLLKRVVILCVCEAADLKPVVCVNVCSAAVPSLTDDAG